MHALYFIFAGIASDFYLFISKTGFVDVSFVLCYNFAVQYCMTKLFFFLFKKGVENVDDGLCFGRSE